MRRRLSGLLLKTVLFCFMALAAALLFLTAFFLPDRLPHVLRGLGVSLLLLIPIALPLSLSFSRQETQAIADALNAMDLAHPERTPIDEELKPLSRKIQEQNAVIAAQMEQIREESANRESQRREFTANVSHELKTPLTTISGTAEILRSGMVKPEDVPHFADNIYKESRRMSTLVSDIIRLSQLEEPKVPDPPKELTDLYSITQDVLSWLQPSAEKLQVTLSLTGTHSMVLGAEQMLSDLVFNLCDNAIKYNRPGGWVKVTVRDSGGQVRLIVADTGIGIPKEHQERVFERFYRVDKSHSREIGGTGLGLSIVKHAAIYHGAELTLRSEEGKGTVVSLLFPDPKQAIRISGSSLPPKP